MEEQKLKEYLFLAVQAGKKETSGLVGELKNDLKTLQSGVDGINKRLDTLNGKVATHVLQIAKLQETDSVNQPILDKLEKEFDETNHENKEKLKRWGERAVWIVIFLVFFLLVKGGFVSPELIDVL